MTSWTREEQYRVYHTRKYLRIAKKQVEREMLQVGNLAEGTLKTKREEPKLLPF